VNLITELLKTRFKFAEWELKGVPVEIAVGPKDLENGTLKLQEEIL
jgi:prolyl-tRNA synthetase